MKRSAIVLACVLAVLSFAAMPSMSADLQTPETTEVFFSPNGGATEAVVREISAAREEVFILAYSFTSKPIAAALLDAHKRGVKIIAVLDKRQRNEKHSAAALISNAGIPVLIDTRHAIAHNKVMLMDRSTLITGSFNFTSAAEGKNAENLLVMKGNQTLIDQYLRNFETHKEHSVPYEGELCTTLRFRNIVVLSEAKDLSLPSQRKENKGSKPLKIWPAVAFLFLIFNFDCLTTGYYATTPTFPGLFDRFASLRTHLSRIRLSSE